MIYSSCLTEEDRHLILDASVVINLLATGCAPEILVALNRPVLLPEPVLREVENGEQRGHGARTKCRDLLIHNRIEISAHAQFGGDLADMQRLHDEDYPLPSPPDLDRKD